MSKDINADLVEYIYQQIGKYEQKIRECNNVIEEFHEILKRVEQNEYKIPEENNNGNGTHPG